MNKYKEAFERICAIPLYPIPKPNKDGYVLHSHAEIVYHADFETLEELVEKATPKKIQKPMKKQKTNTRCPQCDSYVQAITNSKYCGNCGQALDWSRDDNDHR